MLLSALARGLSLVGSMMYTAKFGFTLGTDIYSFAVNLPNLVFNSLGTALMTIVVPIFAGRLAAGERKEAYRFSDSALSISLALSTALAAAGALLAPAIAGAVGRFGESGLATFALRLMFPVMLFHSLGYVLQGVLQSSRRYMAPAAAAACSGLSVILYVATLADRYGVGGLLVATFIGLAMQAVVLIPPAVAARRAAFRGEGGDSPGGASGARRFRFRLGFSDSDVRTAGRLALPVLVASSSYQINMVVNSAFAAEFVGGVVTIANTQNLASVVAQLFILSMLAVYFPRMSASHAVGDAKGFSESFAAVLRLISYFALPASAALAYLSRHLIPLLYGRGQVTEGDIARSCAAFSLYAAAIALIGLKEAADRAFYAAKDSRTPAVAGAFIMALNIALSYALKGPLGLVGLPVAYLVSIAAGSAALLAAARLGGRVELPRGVRSLAAKCCVGSALMVAAMAAADLALAHVLPAIGVGTDPGLGGSVGAGAWPAHLLAVRIAALAAIGAGVYFGGTLIMRVEESRGMLAAATSFRKRISHL